MRKLIHSDFELDLSSYKISTVRENQWFSDGFFTKYSFPIEIDITDEVDAFFGFISRYNSTDIKVLIDCKYYHDNKIEDAVLEVDQVQEKLSVTIYFGLEQLPNWDKKLSELPLEKFELPTGVDIYEHAETIIPQTYPAVNYNFPQVHVDKIDPESDDVWFAFEKIINNRKAGAFLINEVLVEEGEDVTYNRNIMQPLPYWLHILKMGFLDAGLTLSGKVLTDSRFLKKTVYGDVDYFTTVTQESLSLIVMSDQYIETGLVPANIVNGNIITPAYYFSRYLNTLTITQPGKYRLIGTVTVRMIPKVGSWVKIKYRNQIIWEWGLTATFPYHAVINVDVIFSTLADLLTNVLTFESYQYTSTDRAIFQLDVNPIRLHDMAGNPIPNIINKNEIDLTKSVPDVTFGEFVKEHCNWYNYDLDVDGNKAIMNPVEDQINYNDAVNLENHEVKTPYRKFQKGASFLLKFSDIESKEYKFLPVFQDANGVSNSDTKKNSKTNPIEINALPLPLLVRNGVQTAHAFESNNSKIYVVMYDGMTGSLNIAKDPTEILLPAVHLVNWKKWFDFRINSQQFTWSMRMFIEEYSKLSAKSKVYAYGKYHIVQSINDTEVAPDEFEVEIETATIE